jgi:hypothetical protein
MSKRSWTGTVAAMSVAASIALAAQATSTSSAQASASPRAQNAITVTGCVLKADQPAGASTAEAPAAGASASKEAKFVLTNVMPGGANEPTGTSGGAGNASSVKYPLGADASKLTPHVGHRVEITGAFEPAAAVAVGTSSVPTLKVDSIKMVSSTCGNSPQQ